MNSGRIGGSGPDPQVGREVRLSSERLREVTGETEGNGGNVPESVVFKRKTIYLYHNTNCPERETGLYGPKFRTESFVGLYTGTWSMNLKCKRSKEHRFYPYCFGRNQNNIPIFVLIRYDG